jgi:hypothetical protein
MLQNDFKKIKITLYYESKGVNIDVEPYKPLKFLKQRAAQIFYPLNFEVKISYCNKDLTQYDDVKIGEYFKNKSNITVKVYQIIPETKEYRQNSPSQKGSPKQDKPEYICQCRKGLITNYCRECNEFHCKNCRANVNFY